MNNKKPISLQDRRDAKRFAHNLERNINRLGRKPASPPRIRTQRDGDNPPPSAA